jgi:WD40 repeat protein
MFGLGRPAVRAQLELAIAYSRLRAQFQMPATPARAVAWHSTNVFAIGDNAGNLVIWDRAKQAPTHRQFIGTGAQKIVFRPGEGVLQITVATGELSRLESGVTLLGDSTRKLISWDVQSNAVTNYILSKGRITLAPSDVSWCSDGQRVAASNGYDTILIWDLRKSQEPVPLTDSQWTPVNSVAWGPSCDSLAIGTRDGVLRWSPTEGSTVLVGRHMHDAENANQTEAEGVLSLSWNPEGIEIATAGQDRTVRIWLVANPQNPDILSGHTVGIPMKPISIPL